MAKIPLFQMAYLYLCTIMSIVHNRNRLTHCPNDPCCFQGTPIPGNAPLYLVLYMNVFVYFSPDPEVKHYFESALKAKLSVEFMGNAEWFLGTKFNWSVDHSGLVNCQLSQEAYANEIVQRMGLQDAAVSPS